MNNSLKVPIIVIILTAIALFIAVQDILGGVLEWL